MKWKRRRRQRRRPLRAATGKFRREEFLRLVDIAKPRLIYRRGRNHLFAFDGFVMYSQECRNEDFTAKIIDSIEFSNYSWAT